MRYDFLQFIRQSLLILSLLGGTSISNADNLNLDPLVPVNRKIYTFNKFVHAMYITPISMTYSKVMPTAIKTSVGNFLGNFGDIPSGINQGLQGQFKHAASDFMRVIINSTFGICGIFDVATPMGFVKYKGDFGQTLMKGGYKQSTYIVLPILGPSTVRDGIGLAGNSFVSVPYYLTPKWRNRYLAAQMIHNRSEAQNILDVIDTAGVDEYALVRDGYLQQRQYVSNDGELPTTDSLLKGPPE